MPLVIGLQIRLIFSRWRLPAMFLTMSMAFASQTFATTPPMLPPDPVRLAAAEQLVMSLPLESAFGNANEESDKVASNALAWLNEQPTQDRSEVVKQIFYEKVRTESHRHFAAALGDARAALAKYYSYQLSERVLKGAQAFAVTPEGKAFLEVQSHGSAQSLIIRFMYDRTFPDFARLLQSARDDSQILKRIN